MAVEDFLLSVQRQMVDSLGHDYLRQQTRPCRAFFDGLCRLARRTHRAGTRIFQAGIFDHQHRSWNIFVAFAGFLAHQAQVLAASGTVLFLVWQIVDDTLPFEVPRQRLPAAAPFLAVYFPRAGNGRTIVVISCRRCERRHLGGT